MLLFFLKYWKLLPQPSKLNCPQLKGVTSSHCFFGAMSKKVGNHWSKIWNAVKNIISLHWNWGAHTRKIRSRTKVYWEGCPHTFGQNVCRLPHLYILRKSTVSHCNKILVRYLFNVMMTYFLVIITQNQCLKTTWEKTRSHNRNKNRSEQNLCLYLL